MRLPTRTVADNLLLADQAVDLVKRATSSGSYVATSENSCPSWDTSPRCQNTGSNQSLIIGLCVGIPVALAALVLIVLHFKHVKRLKAEEEAAKNLDVDEDEDDVDVVDDQHHLPFSGEKSLMAITDDGRSVRRSFETGTTSDPFRQGPKRPVSFLQPVHPNASMTSLDQYSRSVHSMGENKAYPSNASVYSLPTRAQSPCAQSLHNRQNAGSIVSSTGSGFASPPGGPTPPPLAAKRVRPPFAPREEFSAEDSTLGGVTEDSERDSGLSSSTVGGSSDAQQPSSMWEDDKQRSIEPEANALAAPDADEVAPARRVRIDARVQSIIDNESMHTAQESTRSSGEFEFDEYEREFGRGTAIAAAAAGGNGRPLSQLSRYSYAANPEDVVLSRAAADADNSADDQDDDKNRIDPNVDLGRSDTKHFERVKSIYREYGLPPDPKTPEITQPVNGESKLDVKHTRSPFADDGEQDSAEHPHITDTHRAPAAAHTIRDDYTADNNTQNASNRHDVPHEPAQYTTDDSYNTHNNGRAANSYYDSDMPSIRQHAPDSYYDSRYDDHSTPAQEELHNEEHDYRIPSQQQYDGHAVSQHEQYYAHDTNNVYADDSQRHWSSTPVQHSSNEPRSPLHYDQQWQQPQHAMYEQPLMHDPSLPVTGNDMLASPLPQAAATRAHPPSRPVPPLPELAMLPTPHKMGDTDSPIMFAPNKRRRPKRVVASYVDPNQHEYFEEQQTALPTPSALRDSITLSSLDFAPPRKYGSNTSSRSNTMNNTFSSPPGSPAAASTIPSSSAASPRGLSSQLVPDVHDEKDLLRPQMSMR